MRSGESRLSRPAYDPSCALNPFLSLSVIYNFNEQWNVYGGIR
ncbi:MAG: hypothetical protein ACYSWP_17330 [Planctomycetota bacterium]